MAPFLRFDFQKLFRVPHALPAMKPTRTRREVVDALVIINVCDKAPKRRFKLCDALACFVYVSRQTTIRPAVLLAL